MGTAVGQGTECAAAFQVRLFRNLGSNLAATYLGSGAVRLSIGQSLACGAAAHGRCAGQIVKPKRDEVIVPEVELGDVTVQVLLTAVLIDAAHEDREHALG